ncbi:unnamed protein product [Psylliodes chrysocephalus]|uniref:Uncharacterized protein n=1 Tax=Psylliodes chrysocephalus TaxID=3402493 RepID=A0A9P0GCX3_9CUCU|nr:unnamed protein product [Psylliodes chrysocephala]
MIRPCIFGGACLLSHAGLTYDRLVPLPPFSTTKNRSASATLAGLLTVAKRRPSKKQKGVSSESNALVQGQLFGVRERTGGMHHETADGRKGVTAGRADAVKQLNRDWPPVTGIQN